MLSISAGPLVTTPDRLFFLLALALAVLVGWLYGRRRQVDVQPVLTQMLIFGLVTSRVAFVLNYFAEYRRQPLSMLDIRDGGFLWEAGAVAALGVGLYHAWKNPRIKSTLALAVVSGCLIWGMGIALINTILVTKPPIADLTLTTLDGRTQSFAAFHSKPAVVNLWATWCGPCRREMPVLAEAQKREPQVQFVFVNQGESSADVTAFLNADNVQIKNVFLDPQTLWSQKLGAQAMPTTLFFDAKGKLVGSHTGELSSASLAHALKRFYD